MRASRRPSSPAYRDQGRHNIESAALPPLTFTSAAHTVSFIKFLGSGVPSSLAQVLSRSSLDLAANIQASKEAPPNTLSAVA